jgi:tRNA pseudouridine38-40 synthase
MARYKFLIEYEGTRYSGWQAQKNARTVQGELIGALEGALKTRSFEFVGSGRTDAGVHALAQVAHLQAETMLAPHVLRMKVNDLLPADINVIQVEKVHARFHARHHATSRSYVYQIAQRRTAFGKRHVWWIKDTLDVAAMQQAAALFEGFHDFRGFTRDNPDEKSTKVDLLRCQVIDHHPLLVVHVVGSHFLWNMVRQMVGAIVEVGRGAMPASRISELLSGARGSLSWESAAPSGLFLASVQYDKEPIPEIVPTIRL